MFKNTNKFTFLDELKIKIISETSVQIQFRNETLELSEENKTIFPSDTGETVIEYCGSTTNSDASYSFAKASFKPMGSSSKHYHQSGTEDYYIISGEAQVTIDGVTHKLTAGGHIRILPNQIHQVINPSGEKPLHLIVLCEPAWRNEDYFVVSDVVPSNRCGV